MELTKQFTKELIYLLSESAKESIKEFNNKWSSLKNPLRNPIRIYKQNNTLPALGLYFFETLPLQIDDFEEKEYRESRPSVITLLQNELRDDVTWSVPVVLISGRQIRSKKRPRSSQT